MEDHSKYFIAPNDNLDFDTDMEWEELTDVVRTFAVQSTMNPDIGFAVTVKHQDYEKAKKLVKEGFDAWRYMMREPTEHFEKEDFDWIENVGYAEPAAYLLEVLGVWYQIKECFDGEGDLLPEMEGIIDEFI